MAQAVPSKSKISRKEKQFLLNQKSKVVWFTGLSGSGKTTLSIRLEQKLYEKGFKTCLLDGDSVRAGLNKDLTFSDQHRTENIRRVGEVATLFMEAGLIVLCAFITPFEKDRQWLKSKISPENFIEVYLDCPFSVCAERDVKGLYKLAQSSNIKNFTGLGSSYEIPVNSNVILNTNELDIEDCIDMLVNYLLPHIQLS